MAPAPTSGDIRVRADVPVTNAPAHVNATTGDLIFSAENCSDQRAYGQIIPGLPDDLGRLCLARLSFPSRCRSFAVSRAWRQALCSVDILELRRRLGVRKPLLVLYISKPDGLTGLLRGTHDADVHVLDIIRTDYVGNLMMDQPSNTSDSRCKLPPLISDGADNSGQIGRRSDSNRCKPVSVRNQWRTTEATRSKAAKLCHLLLLGATPEPRLVLGTETYEAQADDEVPLPKGLACWTFDLLSFSWTNSSLEFARSIRMKVAYAGLLKDKVVWLSPLRSQLRSSDLSPSWEVAMLDIHRGDWAVTSGSGVAQVSAGRPAHCGLPVCWHAVRFLGCISHDGCIYTVKCSCDCQLIWADVYDPRREAFLRVSPFGSLSIGLHLLPKTLVATQTAFYALATKGDRHDQYAVGSCDLPLTSSAVVVRLDSPEGSWSPVAILPQELECPYPASPLLVTASADGHIAFITKKVGNQLEIDRSGRLIVNDGVRSAAQEPTYTYTLSVLATDLATKEYCQALDQSLDEVESCDDKWLITNMEIIMPVTHHIESATVVHW